MYRDWIQAKPFDYHLGAIHYTASGFASTCLTNIMIFWFRNISNALFDPNTLTVIRSKITSEKMTLTQSRIIRTGYHIRNIE